MPNRVASFTSLAAAALTGGALVVAAPAQAQAPSPSAARLECPVPVGSPKADVGKVVGAGYVDVRSGCKTSTVIQRLSLPKPRAGDNFGASMTDVHLGSSSADLGLLVGIPNYDVGSLKNAGAVASYRFTKTGYRLDRIITQNSPGIPGSAQAGAQFGAVVASLVAPDDSNSLLVRIGVPRLDVGRAKDAGGVVSLTYTDDAATGKSYTLAPTLSGLVTVDTPGVPGTAHAGDLFGSALGGSDLTSVGVPGRTSADGKVGAGAVLRFVQGTASGNKTNPPQWISQRTKCVPGNPETGDHFGASLAGEWIGVPGEDLQGVVDAGMVNRYAGGVECQSLTAETKGFQGVVHAGDRFGAALAEQHHYLDGYYYPEHLFVGSPGADSKGVKNTGTISWVTEKFDAADGDDLGPLLLTDFGWTAGSRATAGAALGTAFDSRSDLVATAPGGKGLLYVFEPTKTALTEKQVYAGRTARAGTYGTTLLTSQ